MPRGLLLLFLPLLLAAQVRITYLANEGVLLTAGNTRVLVDALFRDSLGDYARHDSGTQERLETGKPPFDGVALALATHYHLDHWDAGAISRFLRLNPAAIFVSTPSATGMIPRSLRDRVRSVWPAQGEDVLTGVTGVRIRAFPLHHGETQNLGFAITVGDRTVVHLGDAETTPANFELLLRTGRPNVALIPWWWLLSDSGRTFVLQRWRPENVVALHWGAEDINVRAAELRKLATDAWLAVRAGESRTY